ncbi:MAG: sulfate ABC transporter permease subunit [Actinobacteria bacterium]|nr:sulfate ABC transporter permease subunit [Actinomycetota bacterium]
MTRRRHSFGRKGPFVYALRAVVVAYLFLLIVWPLYSIASATFANGLDDLRAVFDDPYMVEALRLTAVIAVTAVVINTVFGVGMSLLLVRYEFRGKRLLNALVDLPLSVSPVVVGLALLLVYGNRKGWLGPALERLDLQIIYATPGMILATTFVALPLVIREVVPVLEELGNDQEIAAASLGASGPQILRRITLPAIKWAVLYGVVLSLARSLGEFGAVKVVSGNVLGETRTASLAVEEKYLNWEEGGAYAVAFLLALVSIACITVVTFIRPRKDQS